MADTTPETKVESPETPKVEENKGKAEKKEKDKEKGKNTNTGKRGRAKAKGIKIEVEPPSGTRDFYPDDMRVRTWLFDHFRAVARSFAFQVRSQSQNLQQGIRCSCARVGRALCC